MSDLCEKRLDLHFKQQLSEFDSSFKRIACKSDQIIINYWMHIYKAAPKEQKLSRNCLTLLMYGHLNEFGYLQYPFTDMRNCGKDLNKVLDAYKGLPYLRRVNFAHKGILFGSETTISLDKSPSVLFNEYVLTDRTEKISHQSAGMQNSSSLTYGLPSKYSNELNLTLILRGMFITTQDYIICMLKAKQNWNYYRRTLIRNFTSLQWLHLLLKRKMLNNEMRLLLHHLGINYVQCVQKVCSDVGTFQLKRKHLKWMLDGMECKYLHMTKLLIVKVLHNL
ncbi:hypothetical protein ACLKA7_017320 [Drosophila subpalustris]